MGMSFAYGKADESESLRVLDRSLELGINFWDTAEAYGPHLNEELLGRAMKDRREKVTLATKFAWKGGVASPDNLTDRPPTPGPAVEGSLKRLNTSYIDLLYLHRMDPKVPIEDTVGAMARMVKEGKVRYLGLSEVGPQTLQRAPRRPSFERPSKRVFALGNRSGRKNSSNLEKIRNRPGSLQPRGPGISHGTNQKPRDFAADDTRRNLPRFQGENFQENLKLVEEVKKLGAVKGAAPSQTALAWLLGQGGDIVPIPGTTQVKHLEENAAAVELTLTKYPVSAASCRSSRFRGDRYSPAMAKMVSKD